ncbi:hypothetical protein [Propionicimonas sp.]|uniref:hypothetical protein n=1 Tax=Propionicimonas sp. TaxID=1955623 RepID=UPI0018333C23|nr:hypothetical protein [Propionicimonas sp.]MBU3976540.1 hypothetical protein [Actinomycetota bacterium]MBA3020460.1 hypothetical protein [Propionicimonas sp.]MBU3986633.1 hypothetical protein [Actinomycetota bacterium]MBU4007215.1 hypothetical protein [Actinomycetota bacterium]MBU4064968.1 hypothetical protein [Actinomycetota bacterium]
MGWFSRKRNKTGTPSTRELDAATRAHLEEFLSTRRGIEAFIEQPTSLNPATLLLIAHDGEWTRRSVPDVAWARRFARQHRLPAYDAGVIGYPQRLRDYNSRRRSER